MAKAISGRNAPKTAMVPWPYRSFPCMALRERAQFSGQRNRCSSVIDWSYVRTRQNAPCY